MTASTAPAVESDFRRDLREQLALQLAKEGYLVPTSSHVADVVLMWVSVRLRHIARRVRKTVWSDELRRKRVRSEERQAINRIVRASERGKNLNPHLSRKHLTASFNDLLFNDWRIHHMHLGPRGGRRSGRTGELLFALVTDDTLYLLDVMDHHAFGDVRLVEIVYRNFPSMLPVVATGVPLTRSAGAPLSAAQREKAREAGIQVPVELDGRLYFSTGGITTSGDNRRAVSGMDHIIDQIGLLEEGFRQSPSTAWRVFVTDEAPPRAGLRLKLLVGGATLTLAELNSGIRVELGTILFHQ